jgi:hypothetical protein
MAPSRSRPADAEFGPVKQQTIAHTIDKTTHDYVPIVTLGTTPTVWAVQKGIVLVSGSTAAPGA